MKVVHRSKLSRKILLTQEVRWYLCRGKGYYLCRCRGKPFVTSTGGFFGIESRVLFIDLETMTTLFGTTVVLQEGEYLQIEAPEFVPIGKVRVGKRGIHWLLSSDRRYR